MIGRFLEGLQVFVFVWFMQTFFLAIPSFLIIWFSRKFANFEIWESLVFILPVATWFTTIHLFPIPKGWANLADSLPLVIAIPIAIGIRASLGHFKMRRWASLILILGLCCYASWLHFHTPPEYHSE